MPGIAKHTEQLLCPQQTCFGKRDITKMLKLCTGAAPLYGG
jgi:hypothetical protein